MFIVLEIKEIEIFASQRSGIIDINPSSENKGFYKVPIEILDKFFQPINLIYTLKIEVTGKKTSLSCKNAVIEACKPYIKDINMKGLLTISFPIAIKVHAP